MIKAFRKMLSADLTRWMNLTHSDFLKTKVKMSGTSWSGCDVFTKKGGNGRQAWIVLGGTSSESYITAVLYWTTEGTAWEDLRGWDPRIHPNIPKTGGLQLVDEALVGTDLIDGSRLLEVSDPSLDLQRLAIAQSRDIELYQRVRQRTIADLRAKKTLSEAEIEEYLNRADQLQFSTWEGIEKVMNIPDSCLETALSPVEGKIFYLIEKYGVPFLEHRMARA